MEQIFTKNSSYSELQIGYICSVEIFSIFDVIEKIVKIFIPAVRCWGGGSVGVDCVGFDCVNAALTMI